MLSYSDFHPFQDNAVTELFEHERRLAIIPTGGGKTSIGLTAFKELQDEGVVRRGIVIATKRIAQSVWPNEPAEWEHLVDIVVEALTGPPKRRVKTFADSEADLFSIGIDNIKWLYDIVCTWDDDDPRLDCLMLDESSKVKNPRGEWAKTFRKLAKKFKIVWLMTGSPRPNSELDYFVPMAVLSEDRLWGKSYDKWRRQYFYPTDFQQRDWVVHRHAEQTLNADVSRYSFRVDKKDVPRPASDPIIHRVDLPAQAREHARKMARELYTRVGDTDVIAVNQAVSTGKLAQIAQGFLYDDEKKAHAIHTVKTEITEELLGTMEGDAAVLIYWFKEDLQRLRDLIPGLPYLGNTGHGVSDKRAAEIEDEWNAGNIQHLALHPASAGHGLNLQKVTAQLLHYSLTWSAELYEQVIARVARQGYVGENKGEWLVLNHHIVATGTVDEAKLLRIQGKLNAQDAAMEYLRSV